MTDADAYEKNYGRMELAGVDTLYDARSARSTRRKAAKSAPLYFLPLLYFLSIMGMLFLKDRPSINHHQQ
jgi:hypothetical protein